nr:transposase, Ptta/En/Spm [Tanacetum cinerariifolium]
MAPPFKVSNEGLAILERVYQESSVWLIPDDIRTALVNQVGQNHTYIDNWFRNRRKKDKGVTWGKETTPPKEQQAPIPPPLPLAQLGGANNEQDVTMDDLFLSCIEENLQMRARSKRAMQVQVQQQVESQLQEHLRQWELEANALEEARESEWQRNMEDSPLEEANNEQGVTLDDPFYHAEVQKLEEMVRQLQEENVQMRARSERAMQVQVQRQVESQLQKHLRQWELEANAREEAREREWQRNMEDSPLFPSLSLSLSLSSLFTSIRLQFPLSQMFLQNGFPLVVTPALASLFLILLSFACSPFAIVLSYLPTFSPTLY